MASTKQNGPSNSDVEYIPLMTVDDHDNNDTDVEGIANDGDYSQTTRQSPPLSPLTTKAMYTALAVSVIAFFLSSLSLLSLGRSSPSSKLVADKSITGLRRPSLYIGLERVPEIKLRLDAEALLRPVSGHSGHDEMQDQVETPDIDGVVRPSAFVRLNMVYPDMNWTDENVVLSEADSLVLYFPLPNNARSKQCSVWLSFPTQAALNGRLLTIEGNSPSINISEVTLPGSYHGSASGELTWNRRPRIQRALGSVPVGFGAMDKVSATWQCPDDRVVVELQLICENDASEGCRVEFKGSDISNTFGIALFVE